MSVSMYDRSNWTLKDLGNGWLQKIGPATDPKTVHEIGSTTEKPEALTIRPDQEFKNSEEFREYLRSHGFRNYTPVKITSPDLLQPVEELLKLDESGTVGAYPCNDQLAIALTNCSVPLTSTSTPEGRAPLTIEYNPKLEARILAANLSRPSRTASNAEAI